MRKSVNFFLRNEAEQLARSFCEFTSLHRNVAFLFLIKVDMV